jgi:hypothetical protein
LAMAMAMVLTAAKRQAEQRGSPRCLTLSDHQGTATATSSSTADTASPATNACKRDEAARGVARGGDAGASRLAAQGRGDQHGQGDDCEGKDAGTPNTSVFAGGGLRGSSGGALITSCGMTSACVRAFAISAACAPVTSVPSISCAIIEF